MKPEAQRRAAHEQRKARGRALHLAKSLRRAYRKVRLLQDGRAPRMSFQKHLRKHQLELLDAIGLRKTYRRRYPVVIGWDLAAHGR